MDDYFINLYKNILEKERKKFNVKDSSIRNAIKVMKEAYLPDPSWKSKSISDLGTTDYDDPAFRCAYLHKYAMCYTGMVFHLLRLALHQSNVYASFNRMKKLHMCSLGGGPGTDIVGVLAALASTNLDINLWSAVIIDLAGNWKISFFSILSELQSGNYGPLRRIAKKLLPSAFVLKTNLLQNWNSFELTEQNIRTADVVLMVKFISAAACNFYTERMVEKVFHYLKPGAMVLFIDNAAGGFDRMVKQKALEIGLTSIYGPLLHYDYENSKFDVYRFGSKSQSKSKVAFEVYQKQRFSSDFQRGYGQHRKIIAHAGINYVPESENYNGARQDYEEMLPEGYIRVNRLRRQSTDDSRLSACDIIIFLIILFVIGVVIKFKE